jgi:hypothetical protein
MTLRLANHRIQNQVITPRGIREARVSQMLVQHHQNPVIPRRISMCRHIKYIMTTYAAGSIVTNASRVVWMPITSTQHLDAFMRHGRESLLRQRFPTGETRSRQKKKTIGIASSSYDFTAGVLGWIAGDL